MFLRTNRCYRCLLFGTAMALWIGQVAPADVSAAQGAGPAGRMPVLVVMDRGCPGNPFGDYLTEILRGEGLLAFDHIPRSSLRDAGERLNACSAVILGETQLGEKEEALLRHYVEQGGLLVAMRPDADLADLFGVRIEGKHPERLMQHFAIVAESPLSKGLTHAAMQYHGEADRYALEGAEPLAFLYEDVQTASAEPAATANRVGKGTAVAFAFDLAKSIVLMRQGNPAWQNTEGDGIVHYRPMDMFFRADGRRYFNPDRIKNPQADETQRFLANIVITFSQKPIPRMWYLPGMHKVVVVNTGDAEDMHGTQLDRVLEDCAEFGGSYSVYLRNGEPGRGIERTPPEKEATWRAAGHEVGVHVFAGGSEGKGAYNDLDKAYAKIIGDLREKFGHGSRTARNHTIDWTGWVDMAAIEAKHGTGMDMNYYHYLRGDASRQYGYFTGTGLPQRFIDAEGRLLPIYQATTQWPDEWFADNRMSVEQTIGIMKTMIEAAEQGYYSAFVNNIHPPRYNDGDPITPKWPRILWAYCRDQGIPSWSGERLLDFVEARNGARFEDLTWTVEPGGRQSTLRFTFRAPVEGRALTLMLPAGWDGRQLAAVEGGGKPVEVAFQRIKGIDYGMFTTGQTRLDIVARYDSSEQKAEPPGKSEGAKTSSPGKVTMMFSFEFDRDLYLESFFNEPPQLAIWIEGGQPKRTETVWVTRRAGKGCWEGVVGRPLSLPFWVLQYNRQSGTIGPPTPNRPLPDAITGPTPKATFSKSIDVPPGSRWTYYIEVNVAGDFNERFPQSSPEGFPDDEGNGQPSLVYRGALQAESGARSTPELIGRTRQNEAVDHLVDDLGGVTTAKRLLKRIEVECR